jgi:hypothetical protein
MHDSDSTRGQAFSLLLLVPAALSASIYIVTYAHQYMFHDDDMAVWQILNRSLTCMIHVGLRKKNPNLEYLNLK